MSDQSLISAVSDSLPPQMVNSDLQNVGSETSLHADIAATPVVIRKRRAVNEVQPFSTTKKLVVSTEVSFTAQELL